MMHSHDDNTNLLFGRLEKFNQRLGWASFLKLGYRTDVQDQHVKNVVF